MLGPLEVRTGDGHPVPVPERKVRVLLAALLVNRGRPVPADRLVDDLWGDRPPANPPAALHTKVSRLRQVLGREAVVARAQGYLLRADAVDADEFAALVERAHATADPRTRADLLTEALACWRGPAFADFRDADFARGAVDRLEEQRLTALEALAEARLELGEHGLLADELTEVVAAHPLRERLRAAHLRALYRAGRQGDALTGYEDLRTRLAEELGVDPSPSLTALHQAILRQDGSLEAPRRRTNLPLPLTDLVGRAGAVADVRALLAAHRLVTLTGPGGVGKTRLAVEVASAFPEAWLVEAGAGGLVDAVAAELGVRDEPLTDALRARDLLLVLDNCDHAVDEAAGFAADLLKAAPGVRVLVTSQVPLDVTGEVRYEVPPLADDDAVELFRARAEATGYRADDLAAARAVCRRLDGLPLAVELAAARARTLGTAELLSRLDDRFRLLTKGKRDAPARQRTLRAVLDWSWEPLSEPERAVLRRLAVHVGGCTLEAAEAVCAEPGTAELLDALVDRSLVLVRDGRFRLLESVTAYCLDRLDEAGETTWVLQRHREYYTALAERADLRGSGQRTWLARLDEEYPNLRRALDGAPDDCLSRALSWYWLIRGRFTEARRYLPTGDDPMSRWFLGCALLRGGQDLAESERLVGLALTGFRAEGDDLGVAAALSTRAAQLLVRGDLAAAERAAVEADRLFGRLGDSWGRLQSGYVLASLAEIAGAYPEAARLHREGLRLAEEFGLPAEAADRMTGLGRIALLTGDLAEARALHERARERAAEWGYRAGEVHAELGLALIARRAGDLDLAERLLRSVLDWHREVRFEPGPALVFAELGFVAELRGDAVEAAAWQGKALEIAEAAGDPRAVALALEGLAGARSLAGDTAEAKRLLATAAAKRESVGAPLPPAERGDVDRITARLDGAVGAGACVPGPGARQED